MKWRLSLRLSNRKVFLKLHASLVQHLLLLVAIARLERALGTRLLYRTTRKLRLSESGQQVYQRCLDMVNATQAVMESSGQFHVEPEGIIRLCSESCRTFYDSSAFTRIFRTLSKN